MERDLADILDRWSIAKLKSERIGTDENKREFEAFEAEYVKLLQKYASIPIVDFAKILFDVNKFIWSFEAGLKSEKESLPNPTYIYALENEPVLAKMGIIATEIKYYNHIRVAIKNLINKMAGEGFRDIKLHHLSEDNNEKKNHNM